jgi:hypothetical protein
MSLSILQLYQFMAHYMKILIHTNIQYTKIIGTVQNTFLKINKVLKC